MTDKAWFHATVEYVTPAGNLGSWSGPVFATWETVHDEAKKAARRARRKMQKISGGSASIYPNNYDPTKP